MVVAGVLPSAWLAHSPQTKQLTIGGLDVWNKPGAYGVPVDSVVLAEAGPGAISALDFTIDDPGSLVVLAEGQEVIFTDLVSGLPLFRGYLQDWAYLPAFGTGRSIEVKCIGIEALLDWLIIPSLDTPLPGAGTGSIGSLVQTLCSMAIGIGVPLQWGSADAGGFSRYDFPVAALAFCPLTGATLHRKGVTLRAAVGAALGVIGYPRAASLTIDFYGNVRLWAASLLVPDDYDTALTVSTAGPVRAEYLRHETDATAVPHQVIVAGDISYGPYTDGTGIPGPTGVINDSAIVTPAAARDAATQYLAEMAASIRAEFRLESYTNPGTLTAQQRPGTPLVVTDAQVGAAAFATYIASIEKTFTDAGEDWTVGYGGHPASATRKLRQLTRDVLS